MTDKPNRLKRAVEAESSPVSRDPDDLRAMCHQMNFQHKWTEHQRWYYVEPENRKENRPASIIIEQGANAWDVWTMLDVGRLSYHGWSREKLDTAERRARWLIAQGMLTPTELNGHAA